jgi:hypothetical protein
LPQLILAEIGIAVVGFVISVIWGAISGRNIDRDTTLFLVKMWSGIALILIVIAVLMAK